MGIQEHQAWRWMAVGMLAVALAGCQTAGAQSAATPAAPTGQAPSAGQAAGANVLLSGQEEVPPVSTSAAGTGIIRVAPDRSVTGKVTYSGVNATMAHIHQGAKGSNGPPIVTLAKASDSTFVVPEGTRLTEDQFAQYKAGNLYINIHSNRYPNGELRAQLQPQ